MNKLLSRQLRRHFGSENSVPEEFRGFLEVINSTYENFDDDSYLLQNSIEISSQELREAYNKHKEDAASQRNTILKIKDVIAAFAPDYDADVADGQNTESDLLLDALIRLIEQQKAQEQELLKMSWAVEQNPASVVITDLQGNIEYVNRKFCELTGYSREEVIGQNPRILKTNNYPEGYHKEVWDTILKGQGWQGEFQNKKKNGELYWELASITAVKNSSGEVINFLAIKEDITDAKKNQEIIENQRTLFRTIIDLIPDAVYVKDRVGKKVLANPTDVLFAGKELEAEVIGKTDQELYPNELAKKSYLEDMSVINSGASIINEEGSLVDKNGKYHSLLISKVPLFDVNGKITGLVGVTYDVSEQKEYEKVLLEARTEAELANKAKSEFLANVSHEIRTPMNAIIGFSEILLGNINSAKQRNHIKSILSSGRTLMALINDILDLSKIESGRMEMELDPMNINVVFKEIEQVFTIKANKKQISLELEICDSVKPHIFMDEVRFHQILFNIVGNAIKFTENGFVKLRIEMAETKDLGLVDLVVHIEDSGIGIPENQQEKIFNSFTQQSGQSNRKYGGTGLGLAISKRLAEKLNGKIELQSVVGKGTTFSVHFFNVKLADAFPDTDILEPDYTHLKFEESKVLLVDDIDFNIQVVQNLIDHEGITFIEANSGEAALELLEFEMPDLIFMDIRMHGMSGVSATRIIKSTPKLKHIPVVAFTASAMAEQEQEIKEGFDGLLRKPASKQQIVEMLKKFIKHSFDEDKNSDNSELRKELINEGCLATLPELLVEIDNRLLERWKEISGTLVISKIEEFCTEIENVNTEFQCNLVGHYAKQLREAIEAFDIESIEEQINSFDNLFETLKTYEK